METLLYLFARALVSCLQALPLLTVARFGRAAGGLAYWLDGRHRRVALRNLQLIFGSEKTGAEIRALARENFRRLGENYGCAVKTAIMTLEQLRPHFEIAGLENFPTVPPGQKPPSVVAAIGHFGNFELYARVGQHWPQYQCATTYRGLREESLNRLMQSLRERSGCLYFERRTGAAALKAAMKQPGILLGLLADQRAGKSGVVLPFLGRECSTSTAPAVLALRYDCPLLTGICYRVAPAKWRIEFGPQIPTREGDSNRAVADIMCDVNRVYEAAVRRDPANWFWVHDRWKQTRPKGESQTALVKT
jgi:lauroyl/myristoyl acyltransferase